MKCAARVKLLQKYGIMQQSRGRTNVQSTQKWEVNNLFVQSIFQFCAVNFSILNNNIFIILIKF